LRIASIAHVFVPFEIGFDGLSKRREDLPIFLTADEASKFIRHNPRLGRYKLEWRMHSERDLIEEFVKRWYASV
jgi:hypothetical protein